MEKFPIKPMFDRVFVRKDSEEKTESGFYLPETIKGRAKTGVVVAVGHGWLNTENGNVVPLHLKVGDRIFVKEFDGYMIEYKGEKVWVFRENEIIGILEEE